MQASGYSGRRAPKEKIEELGNRMYQQAKRLQQKKAKLEAERKQEKSRMESMKYSHKPDLAKKKFVKFPQPVKLHPPCRDVFLEDKRRKGPSAIQLLDERNRQFKAKQRTGNNVSAVNLNRSLERATSKVTTLYNWNSTKQQKLQSRFMEQQLNRSFESLVRSTSKESQPRRLPVSRVLSGSLQNLHIPGTDEFLIRQRKAEIMRRQHDYLLKFPNSYIFTYRDKFESSMDSTPTHYLDFGSLNSSRLRK